MVALGSIFSSIWITVANSWQQTPAGHHIVPMMRDGKPWVIDGEVIRRAEIVDFWAMVFNPSSIHRLVHVWIGCFILGAAFIMSISAWYILRGKHVEFARRSFTGALGLATISSLAILLSGHSQAQSVYKTQPAKLAAFEAQSPGRWLLTLANQRATAPASGTLAVASGPIQRATRRVNSIGSRYPSIASTICPSPSMMIVVGNPRTPNLVINSRFLAACASTVSA
jgi:cytochrome bd-type quinol oxidase subunit 1